VQESFNRLSGLKPSIKSTQNINPMKSCMKVPQLTNEQIEERYKVCVSEAIALGVKPPVPAQSEGEMNVRAHRYHISCLESQRHLIGENLFPYLFHSTCLFVPFFSALLSVCLSVCSSVCRVPLSIFFRSHLCLSSSIPPFLSFFIHFIPRLFLCLHIIFPYYLFCLCSLQISRLLSLSYSVFLISFSNLLSSSSSTSHRCCKR
jgi:hypothetical protein